MSLLPHPSRWQTDSAHLSFFSPFDVHMKHTGKPTHLTLWGHCSQDRSHKGAHTIIFLVWCGYKEQPVCIWQNLSLSLYGCASCRRHRNLLISTAAMGCANQAGSHHIGEHPGFDKEEQASKGWWRCPGIAEDQAPHLQHLLVVWNMKEVPCQRFALCCFF